MWNEIAITVRLCFTGMSKLTAKGVAFGCVLYHIMFDTYELYPSTCDSYIRIASAVLILPLIKIKLASWHVLQANIMIYCALIPHM